MRLFFISLFCVASLSAAAQRTHRFEGGEGSYSGKFRYSAGSERISLKGFTGLNFPDRLGAGVGYGRILRRERSWLVEAAYYHNVVVEQEQSDALSVSFTYYWSFIKLGSGSRVLFGLSPTAGYQFAKSLKIESAEAHTLLWGCGAKLEYEHLLGGNFGLFFGATQNIECLNRITQARLRHFLEVGLRIGI
jgi:hypothetical protein